MKKIFAATLFLSTVGSARAQEAPEVRRVENTQQEIFEMLNMLGVSGFRFDLSAFTAGEYEFAPFIEEYVRGEKVVSETEGFRFGATRNWQVSPPEDAFDSPESRERWFDGKKRSVDAKKYLAFEHLGLFLAPQNDSTARVRISLYGAMSLGFPPLKLRPLEHSDPIQYTYQHRPFKFYPIAEERQRVPLLLYGSFWWDEKYKVHRFCGENEIEPDLSSDIVKDIPHYYIIGVEVRRVE